MRKSLTALSLVAALFAGQAMADQATLDALQTAGVVLNEQQAAQVVAATGDELVALLAQLAVDNPSQAGLIEAAGIQASPHLADEISKAIEVALNNSQAKPEGPTDVTGAPVVIPTNSIPSVGGTGGGGNPAASPN